MSWSEDAVHALVERAFAGQLATGALALVDDAATLPPCPPGRTRVVTTDVVVEEVDFSATLAPLATAGARAIVQNVSDLAAMGAAPVGFVWSLAIPPGFALEPFVEGAAAACRTFGLPLYGGDISSTSGPLVCSITAFGDVDGAPLLRGGARPGDRVFVGGTVGGSAAGLRALFAARAAGVDLAHGFDAWRARLPEHVASAVDAHLQPAPQLALGQWLVGRATACLDVSDGVLLDLARMGRASKVGVVVDGLAQAVHAAADDDTMSGGEDYVLLFALPPDIEAPARAIEIGRVVEGEGLWRAGERLAPRGYVHGG
jgi:thiamine-monophosphate kinase